MAGNMKNGNDKALLDRIKYYMENPEDEQSFCSMFHVDEQNILHTIRDFEQLRGRMKRKIGGVFG